MAVLLLPGVLQPNDTAGGSRTDEVEVLREYNSALADRNTTLREGMRVAECLPDGGYDVPRHGTPPVSPTDLDDRLQREGAAGGAIEVTLAWNGSADVDLSVICPGGERIWFDNKSACGGTLDVDMNVPANVSEQPIEHVTWPENAAPPGVYQVNATYFADPSERQPTIPVLVDIKVGAQSKRLSRTLPCCRDAVFIDSFTIGAAGPTDAPVPPMTPTPPDAAEPDVPPLPPDPDATTVQQDGSRVPLTEVVEKGVVFVIADDPASPGTKFGSGFLISDRQVVTNRHVIEGTSRIFVVSKALGRPRPVKIFAQTPSSEPGQLDFAVLEAEDSLSPGVPLTLTPAVARLEQVVSAGYPGFLFDLDEGFRRLIGGDLSAAPEVVTTEGIIARPAGAAEAVPLLMHSADIAQGDSGGPLLDICGRVVGVNTLVRPGSETNFHTSWAIGTPGLKTFLDGNAIATAFASGPCVPETGPSAVPADPQGG